MKKILIIISVLFANTVLALELGTFQAIPVKKGNEGTTIALIDNSSFSQNWLNKNADYLITKKIPVLVLNTEQKKVTKLNKKYKGLLAGVAPKPQNLIYKLANQMGVIKYPAVVEKGIIWQVNPHK